MSGRFAVLAVLLVSFTQEPRGSATALDVPLALRGERLEAAVVCRGAHGLWEGVGRWLPLESDAPRVRARTGCRVLLRHAGSTTYLASRLVTGREGLEPLVFGHGWLRTARAGPASSHPYWAGASASRVECTRTADASLCLFVPAAESGVLVTLDETGLRVALSRAPGTSATLSWAPMVWGRLVRVSAHDPEEVRARVTVLEAALAHGSGFLRQARESAAARVHGLGGGSFWIEGGPAEAGARLEISGPGAATARIDLDQLRGSPLTILEVSLSPEEIIAGDVRSRGVLLAGATASLMRLLALPGLDVEDDERPMELVGENTTDESGRFRFDRLSREKHELLVWHPQRGRTRLVITAPALTRVTLAPHAVARGRVMRSGVPVAGAAVAVLPSFDTVVEARNPISLLTEPARTSLDGRFELLLPEKGRLTLTAMHEGGATRLDLGDAGALPPVVDVGDVRLEEPPEVIMLLDIPATCVVRAAGPIGLPGIMLREAEAAGPGRWLLRSALEGRWLVEASCGGHDVPLEASMVEVTHASRDLIRLTVRR